MTSGVTVLAAELAIAVAGLGRSFGTTVVLHGRWTGRWHAVACSGCWDRMVRAGRRRGTVYLPTQELGHD